MTQETNDLLEFTEEDPTASLASSQRWNILIVDDEPDVHAVTKLALKSMQIEGRELAFFHAFSAAEAMTILEDGHDFAVALVDVVMEQENSGLELVHHIRDILGNHAIRVILRTGQPGYAPEIDTLRQYDINDYKTKTELTQVRLFSAITIAIRSYAQIRQLESARRGLGLILTAATELGKPTGLNRFASGIVTQLCALLEIGEEGLVCAAEASCSAASVLAAAGSYSDWIGLPLKDIPEPHIRDSLELTLQTRQNSFGSGACLFFPGARERVMAAYVDVPRLLDEGELGLLRIFCSNISVAYENLQLYETIKDLAYVDTLVKLPNRNAFLTSIESHQSEQNTVALVDLDGFSDINSILDDSFGDLVLQAVAQRLRGVFSDKTCVSRISSDLFGLHGPTEDVTPERISSIFSVPFAIGNGEPLRLSATSGLVLLHASDRLTSAVEIMKNAGAALKQAKRTQRGKSIRYQADLADAARDRMHLLSRLRTAFSTNRLQLHYQPLVNLRDGRIVGAECLLRWMTEDGSFVPPDRIIPLAEQSGLMVPIGEWVLRTALKWRASLKDRVEETFRVAINVSHAQFCEPDFVPMLMDALTGSGLAGHHIELELTESVAVENLDMIADKLSALRSRDISVAMDDFGTGYSSLGILQRLHLNRVKIDRSFVSGPLPEVEPYGIAKTIVVLAKQLRLKTTAEGIETEGQRQMLLETGCEEGQGYLFSRPVDENAFLQFLEQDGGKSQG